MSDSTYEAVAGIIFRVAVVLVAFVWAIPFGWAWDGVRSAFTTLPHLDYWQCFAVLFVAQSILPSRVIALRRDAA